MSFRSKKALTLIEVLISVAIIALIAITLLGVSMASLNSQRTAGRRNQAGYQAADELEKKLYSLLDEKPDLSDDAYMNISSHTLSFTVGGQDFESEGTLIESLDPEAEIHLIGFFPDAED